MARAKKTVDEQPPVENNAPPASPPEETTGDQPDATGVLTDKDDGEAETPPQDLTGKGDTGEVEASPNVEMAKTGDQPAKPDVLTDKDASAAAAPPQDLTDTGDAPPQVKEKKTNVVMAGADNPHYRRAKQLSECYKSKKVWISSCGRRQVTDEKYFYVFQPDDVILEFTFD